nr:RNA-directed DNA polymerase, eukaryota, reverse transcriptase zinc-binding domain protein [Tanacetum cinerariifolium]
MYMDDLSMEQQERLCGGHLVHLGNLKYFRLFSHSLDPIDESNTMRNVMIKLKFFKRKIREWLNDNRNKSKSVSDQFKEELQKLDADIDKGIGSDDIVNKRLEVLNSIPHLDKIKAMDVAQKAKIKWAIEGDENTRYFHGVLNKKISQLNICGIMVDGKWTKKPNNVKLEFLHHFRNRFDKPTDNRVHIDMNFPKSITIDQQMDLECAVSKEELERAVWECGTDKSPGPDGFSFGFYRQFWSSIENDVFATVSHFFTFGDIPNGSLPINMCKSKIMGVNVGDEKVKSAASKLRCLILNTLFSYLGTKVRGNMSRVQAWTEVVDKASWVKWKGVLASKEKGGLGVSSLYALNRALMMKWVWRFYSQKESLWERVIKAFYDDDGQVGKVSKAGSRSYWRNIVNEVRILSNQGIKVLDYMWIKVKNRGSTAFWDDNWIGGKVLKYSFLRIYALETEKEVTVNSKMSDTRLENSLRRGIRGGVEQVQFNELSDMLQLVSLMPYSDRWVWSLEGSGEFSVASIRKIIDENRLSIVDIRTLWIKYVPIKSKSKLMIEAPMFGADGWENGEASVRATELLHMDGK